MIRFTLGNDEVFGHIVQIGPHLSRGQREHRVL
jgi:hypothetical protein